MKYFLDTEFIESPGTIDLISIGLVAEDGREYYAINRECDFESANEWVKAHVIAYLDPSEGFKTKAEIREDLFAFIGQDIPEFWGYYADYDWVLLAWLFGAMVDLPDGWPMFCYDLRQWLNHQGFAEVFQPDTDVHHALSDARWIAETYQKTRVP